MPDEEAEPKQEVPNVVFSNDMTSVPTVYADHCYYVSRFNGSVRLSFVETIILPPEEDVGTVSVTTRHVGHLTMPQQGFENMARYLNSTIANWEEHDRASIADGE